MTGRHRNSEAGCNRVSIVCGLLAIVGYIYYIDASIGIAITILLAMGVVLYTGIILTPWILHKRREHMNGQTQLQQAMTYDLPPGRSISQDTKIKVSSRDGGRCVSCGSPYDLQFDHIIPFSQGGGNSPDNIQLLCGSCNRRKYNHM